MVTPLRSRYDRSPPQSPVKVVGGAAGGGSDRWYCPRAGDPQSKPKDSAAAANVHAQRRPAIAPISPPRNDFAGELPLGIRQNSVTDCRGGQSLATARSWRVR